MPAAAAVVYVKDLDRVAAFYAGVVGLALDARENDHAVLRADEFQLILVRMPDALARDIEVRDQPVRREHTPIKLVLPVVSLAGARGRAGLRRSRRPGLPGMDVQGRPSLRRPRPRRQCDAVRRVGPVRDGERLVTCRGASR